MLRPMPLATYTLLDTPFDFGGYMVNVVTITGIESITLSSATIKYAYGVAKLDNEGLPSSGMIFVGAGVAYIEGEEFLLEASNFLLPILTSGYKVVGSKTKARSDEEDIKITLILEQQAEEGPAKLGGVMNQSTEKENFDLSGEMKLSPEVQALIPDP